MVLEADNEKGTLTSFFSKKQPPPPMDSNIKKDENPQDDEVIIINDQRALAEPMEHTPHVEQPNVDGVDAAGNPSNAIQASKQPSNNNSKKRKGRPSILDTVTEEQAAALEVFYSSHPKRGSINSTNTAELASRIGLDTSKITTWIEHRRKKAKAEATASPDVPIQQQPAPPPPAAAPLPSAPILPPTSVPPSTAIAPCLPAAAGNNNIHILLEPNTEVKRTIVDGGGPVITPAPALAAPHTISRQQIPEQPQPQQQQQQQQQPVNPPPAPPAAVAATVELPAGFPKTIKQIEQLKANFCIEIANLKTKGLSPPLISLDSNACLSVQPFTDVLLAKHVVGQRMTRSALIATLRPLFTIAVQANTTTSDAADGGIDGGQQQHQQQQASTIINTAVPEDLLLARLLDIATRRSYAPKSSNKGGKSGVGSGGASSSFSAHLTKDPLDDDSPDMLWQWELRDVKLLANNKDIRSKAVAIKKRAAKVQERLGALQFALEVFGEYKPLPPSDQNTGKAVRAFTNLAKTVSFESMENEMKNEESMVAKQQETEDAARQRALLKAEKEAEKEKLKAEKEAEKERLRAEKEAEREKVKAEKEAEKEKVKAEKEQSKQQKNAQKMVKQTGFKDTKQLERSKNKFMQFFGKAPQTGAATTTTNTTDNNNTSQGQNGQQQQQQQQQPGSPQSQGAGSASRSRLPKKERTCQDMFLKPTPDTVFPQPTFSSLVDSMDSALFGSTNMIVDLTGGQEEEEEQQQKKKKEMMEFVVTEESTVLQDWQSTVHQWKQNKRTATQQKATSIPLGLPPTWSRIPGLEGFHLASAAVNQHLDFGFDHATIKTYRRKFLWFESDSKRPPFYGSFSKVNKDIRPRHHWGRDDELDYEVMSDLDWEEEPDGSSLSEADSDDEDDEDGGMFGGAAAELEDSEFIKPDGYLSEDEGVGLEEGDDDDAGCSVGGGDVTTMMVDGTGTTANMVAGMRQKKRLGLEMQMERARKCHKPLFISRLPTNTTITPPLISEQQQHHQPQAQNTSFIQGDVSLLEGICWEVLVPGAVIEMPPDPAQVAAAAAAAAVAAQANIAAAAAAAKLVKGSSLPVVGIGTGVATITTTTNAAPPSAASASASAAAAAAGTGPAVLVGGGGDPRVTNTKPTMERPEELVPSLLSILQSNPKKGGDKIIEEFIAAHQGRRKIVKKWALTRLKEHAAYVKNQWQLNDKGLALLGVLSSGGGGGGGGGGGTSGGGGIALQQPATAGPLLAAFLKSAPPNTTTTTTTTTATATATTPTKNDATTVVGMGDQVPLSSWKNYWQSIVRSIEHSTDNGSGEEKYNSLWRVASAFTPREKLVSIIGDIPAFVVSALVVSLLQHPGELVAESLCSIVDVLVDGGGGVGGGLNNDNDDDNNATTTTTTTTTTITAPSQQQVFAQRTGPARVSLSGLCGEPLLMDALVSCLDVNACRKPALMMVKKLMLLEEVRNGVGGVGQLRKVVEKVQKQQSMMVSQRGGDDYSSSGLHLGAAMSLATEVVDLAGSLGILSSSSP